MRKALPIIILLGILATESAVSQSFYSRKRERRLIATAGTGTANYMGDLVGEGQIGLNYNTTIGARYRFYDRYYLGLDFTVFKIEGSDQLNAREDYQQRNLSFFSTNTEMFASIQVDFFETPDKFYMRKFLNPYIYFGYGVVRFEPKTEYEGETVKLRPLQTEGVEYDNIARIIPVGIGVKIRVTPFLNIAVDGGARYTDTDYMDDVSGAYENDLENGYPGDEFFEGREGFSEAENELAANLSDRSREVLPEDATLYQDRQGSRGGPSFNDAYFIFNARVEYFIPSLSFGGGSKGGRGKSSGGLFGNRPSKTKYKRQGDGFFKNLFGGSNKPRKPKRRR